jgi:hypothetical protein
MFTVTQENSNSYIHGNGHRRKHTAIETYMVMVTEESGQQQKYTCANGHGRKHTATETYMC